MTIKKLNITSKIFPTPTEINSRNNEEAGQLLILAEKINELLETVNHLERQIDLLKNGIVFPIPKKDENNDD